MEDCGFHNELNVHRTVKYEQNVEKIIAKRDTCFLKWDYTILFLAYCTYQQILQLTFGRVLSSLCPCIASTAWLHIYLVCANEFLK